MVELRRRLMCCLRDCSAQGSLSRRLVFPFPVTRGAPAPIGRRRRSSIRCGSRRRRSSRRGRTKRTRPRSCGSALPRSAGWTACRSTALASSFQTCNQSIPFFPQTQASPGAAVLPQRAAGRQHHHQPSVGRVGRRRAASGNADSTRGERYIWLYVCDYGTLLRFDPSLLLNGLLSVNRTILLSERHSTCSRTRRDACCRKVGEALRTLCS